MTDMSMIQKFELQGKPDEGFIAIQKGKRWQESNKIKEMMNQLEYEAENFFRLHEDSFDFIDQLIQWTEIQKVKLKRELLLIDSSNISEINATYKRYAINIQDAYFVIVSVCDTIFEDITSQRRKLQIQFPKEYNSVFGADYTNYTVISNDNLSKYWMRALKYRTDAKYEIEEIECKLDKIENSPEPSESNDKPIKRTRFGNNK